MPNGPGGGSGWVNLQNYLGFGGGQADALLNPMEKQAQDAGTQLGTDATAYQGQEQAYSDDQAKRAAWAATNKDPTATYGGKGAVAATQPPPGSQGFDLFHPEQWGHNFSNFFDQSHGMSIKNPQGTPAQAAVKGPDAIANPGSFAQAFPGSVDAVNQAQRNAQMLGSDSGRESLIQGQNAGKGGTAGGNRLDNFLLGANAGDRMQKDASSWGALQGQLDSASNPYVTPYSAPAAPTPKEPAPARNDGEPDARGPGDTAARNAAGSVNRQDTGTSNTESYQQMHGTATPGYGGVAPVGGSGNKRRGRGGLTQEQ